MRFSVVSYGSEGDTRPIAALCRSLMDAGHDVRFFCEQSSLAVAEASGVPHEALPGDIRSTMPLANPFLELRSQDLIGTARASLHVVNANTEDWMRRVAEHAQSSDAILYSGLTMLLGVAVGQGLRIPAVGLMLQPLTAPTAAFATALLPPHDLPGWMNRWTYHLSRALIQRFYGKATRAAREKLFGISRSAPLALDGPAVYGMSRYLVAQPRDWPDTHRVCGAWTFSPAAYQAPEPLKGFLEAGEPPIYLGFGAFSSLVRGRTLQHIVDAVDGQRAVFYPGWSSIDASMLPGNFFVTGHTDHAWLFPRMSMIIHHAGAGTSHSACRAGVPSVALPFAVDQPFWAGRLHAAGVAPRYVRGYKVPAGRLAGMIEFAQRADVREKARELAALMATEQGAENAVRELERLVHQLTSEA